MRYSADRFFDETDLFDLRIVGTLGLTDEDVEAVRAIDGVEQVMPAYSSDAIVNTPSGDALVARIQSVPLDQIEAKEPQGYLNRMEVVEGRLPVKEDECVVEEGSDYHAMGFSVGDTLTISPENEDWEDTFARNELKVVGVVSTSAYFSIERESASVGDGTVDVNLRYGDFDWGWQCCHLTLTPGQPLPEPGTPEGIFQPGRRMEAGCPAIARQPRLPDALAESGGGQ